MRYDYRSMLCICVIYVGDFKMIIDCVENYSLSEKVFLTCYREHLFEELENNKNDVIVTSEHLDEYCLKELQNFRNGKTKLTLHDEGGYTLEFF